MLALWLSNDNFRKSQENVMTQTLLSRNLGLEATFKADHQQIDGLWAEVEAAVEREDAEAVPAAWRRFDAGLRRHLAMEEEVLFPAFEAATGMTQGGPTFVMRSEHAQMRGVLDQMAQAMAGGDHRELVDQGDTLLILIQQHNAKEEGMLYPMAERALGGQWSALRERLAGYFGADRD
jgi:hemerythrin-like domain-containing protein